MGKDYRRWHDDFSDYADGDLPQTEWDAGLSPAPQEESGIAITCECGEKMLATSVWKDREHVYMEGGQCKCGRYIRAIGKEPSDV